MSSPRRWPKGGADAQGHPTQGEAGMMAMRWLSAPEPSLSREQGVALLTEARRWRHPRVHQRRRGEPLCLSLKTNQALTQAATRTNLTHTVCSG